MAEVHVNVGPIDKSGNQIIFHSPGVTPTPASAGKAVTTNTTTGTHGSVNNGNSNAPQVVVDNPA